MTTERKLAKAAEGVNGVALKVLAVVPLQERWTREQIAGELRRTGSNVSPTIIYGCLDTLRGRGLVREPEPGKFYRVAANAAAVAGPADVEADAAPAVEAAHRVAPVRLVASSDAPGPIDRLGTLAGELRGCAAKLGALAQQVEEAALDAQQSIDDARAETGKLAHLREILRTL